MTTPELFPPEETTYKGMFEWLEEHATGVVAETHSIADTGDYSVQWVVYNCEPKPEAIGWGDTAEEAIRDAMKDPEDPTKYNYIPPEYRR